MGIIYNRKMLKNLAKRCMQTSEQRIKGFYKKVDVVEHPVMKMLQPSDLKNANFMTESDSEIDLTNLSQIREGKDVFFAVTLDEKPIKTMYKDALYIPSRALAVALAEEWES